LCPIDASDIGSVPDIQREASSVWNMNVGNPGIGVLIATLAVIVIVVAASLALAIRRRSRRGSRAGWWWQGPNAPEDPEPDLHTRHQWE
jgi:hypothetical protein